MRRTGKRRTTQTRRCVCGQPITHPPILPGERKPTDKSCPPDVASKGHAAHTFDYNCTCGYCLTLA